ncbi:MAG: hypothetical protein JW863_10405 [Chitinispirillaceae bacterium]|nr:hypothetical protein [Chitinispirillaceae bacterium]
MKKLHLLLPAADRETFLEDLARVGIVHVEERVNENRSDNLEQIGAKIKQYRSVHHALEGMVKKSLAPVPSGKEASDIIKQFETLEQKRDEIQQKISALQKDIAVLTPWGDFNPTLIEKLRSAGITLRFFETGLKKFPQLDFTDITYEKVHSGNKIRFIVFERENATSVIDADEISLPMQSLKALINEITELEKSINAISAEINALVPFCGILSAAIDKMELDERFERARTSFESAAGGKIVFLTGWLPASREGQLRSFLNKKTVWFEILAPSEQDAVPILLKNNAFFQKFETVIRLFQLPNYRELDPTAFVAPFYAIFFGTCLGDAGYALIIIIASLIAFLKLPKTVRPLTVFGLILGFSTLIMGIVNSGTVFGITILEKQNIPLFAYLSRFIVIKNGQSIDPFNFALLLGVIQINVGIVTNIANRLLFGSFKHSLPAVAKLLIIDSLIILFLALYQNFAPVKPLVQFAIPALIIGTVVMVYAVLIAGMEQLMDNRMVSLVLKLYFTLSGAVGDILSYIRLFALGLSSGILGYVINDIGFQMAGIKYVGWIACILFLVIGHVGNLLLSGLGSFVHPLRLTFVEFYGNLEFKGGGKEYSPLKN